MHRCGLLLILLAFLTCSLAQQDRYHRAAKTATSCCRRVSSAMIRMRIDGFERQSAEGPCIEAIVFHTKRGKVCTNPRARWVAEKMKELPEFPKTEK